MRSSTSTARGVDGRRYGTTWACGFITIRSYIGMLYEMGKAWNSKKYERDPMAVLMYIDESLAVFKT